MDETVSAILEGMAARRLSRGELAGKTGYSESHLHKILSGNRPLSPSTVRRISSALDIEIGQRTYPVQPAVSPDELGAYSRTSVSWMEANYLAIRRSFHDRDSIIAYAIVVEWDSNGPWLAFRSSDDFSSPVLQRGRVSFSTRTGHFYLLASDLGRFDLTILGNPDDAGRLHGLCTTAYLRNGLPTPASTAISLLPTGAEAEFPLCGPITRESEAYSLYSGLLSRAAMDGLARVE